MAPDYDPSRDGHVKKKFIVQKAWPGKGTLDPGESIQTSKGELQFNHEGRLVINDQSLAREVQQQYPRELAVTRVRYPAPADRGHRYHFGQMPAMPWHRYDENGNRIKEEEWQSQFDLDRQP